MPVRVGNGSLCALVALVSGVVPTFAGFETIFEVAQPIATEEGIVISTVTIRRSLGHYPHGLTVGFTSAASCVASEEVFENRNVANILGLVAGAEPFHSEEQTLYGDTLRVFVDASSLGDRAEAGAWSAAAVVQATVEATLINAWRSREAFDHPSGTRTAARIVHLEIRGTRLYSDLEGAYGEGAITALPSRPAF